MTYPFAYDKATAVEALLYIAERAPDLTLHKAFKLMYFADRRHLEEYGRLIFGDQYVAMKNGPVPSATYNMTRAVRGDESTFFDSGEGSDGFVVVEGFRIEALRRSNLHQFSASELECLDEAIKTYGALDFRSLSTLSHDASWRAADVNDRISIDALTLGMRDRQALLESLANSHP